MITPILNDPRKHGGTLYTFPSASRDLTRSFSNSDYKFAFSHFACLNLPDFRYGTFKEGQNLTSDSDSDSDVNKNRVIGDLKGVYFENIRPHSMDETSGNVNRTLKWHLQSYVMNYEIAILNGFSLDSGKYDNEILRTPSERIFFNWLYKVGAIRFNGNVESLEEYGDEANNNYIILNNKSLLETQDKSKNYRIGNKLYFWKGGEWRSRILVSKTVQYIGIIDTINNVNIDYDSFNEIYLNIPSSVGGTPEIHFNQIFDQNYEKGEEIKVKDDNYCNTDDEDRKYIIGRYEEEPNDITLTAIYDTEFDLDSGYISPVYNIETGYCINFNDSEYIDSIGRIGIEHVNMESEEDFEFNCVLIYYKIKKGDGNWVTNLYGILFLEEAVTSDYNINVNEDDERAGYIQRYPKFKKGNSWGLKLDLKIDAQPDSQMELRDKTYDDPNDGVDMQMFTEALIHLNDCAKIFYEVKKENTEIEERLYKLENIVSGVDTMYELREEVGVLRNKMEIIQPIVNSIDGRIEDIEDRMTKLENNFGYFIKDVQKIMKEVENKVQISLMLNDDNEIGPLDKIIII